MRGKQSKPRELNADPVYGSSLVTKLVNRAMYDGKKSVAQKEVYQAFKIMAEKTGEEALSVFEKALGNIKPVMEVRARRIGGAAYQVPMSVRGRRQETLAIRWLIEAARAKSNSEFHTFAEKLASEVLDALNNEGGAMKKRTEVEKVADANKAFAHFRW
ncbi:30S ribosomal protein S7 [Candidatus Woesebacteria bacterium]|jgi:small subunit ribosomal protein S7|nr:30S ribosomal protein S7 [Candidatus Woesebacteria bacterium]